MTQEEIVALVGSVAYKRGWSLFLGIYRSRPYVQVHVSADVGVDAVTGERTEWRGGKHYLSMHMCRQEIIGACFGAIKAAEEHEMREWFRYKGVRIFNPHLDPEALVAFAADPANHSVREPVGA